MKNRGLQTACIHVKTNKSLDLDSLIADGISISNSADGYYIVAFIGVEATFSNGRAER
ncbi:hypothetical protein [Leptospira santarosai]|uniref:hypothetical protein n=1 Tax=Leptospira santarosai TaxID=28183 RepID=UPI0015C3734A|nr:hypothetical protein [Leptospira santarosai]